MQISANVPNNRVRRIMKEIIWGCHYENGYKYLHDFLKSKYPKLGKKSKQWIMRQFFTLADAAEYEHYFGSKNLDIAV